MSDYGPPQQPSSNGPPPPYGYGPPGQAQPQPPFQPQPGYGYYGPPPVGAYATWGNRVVATLWDVVHLWPAYVTMFVGVVLLGVGIGIGGSAGVLIAIVGGLAIVGGYAWAIVRYILNYIVDQGRTGYTWGKRKVGIRVVHEATGQPPGIGSCVGRYFLHVFINYAVFIDYLWPLWDQRSQTLTDKVLTTVVIRQPAS